MTRSTAPDPDREDSDVVGLHHIRIPVTDPWVSRDWYMTAVGLRPLLHEEEENEVTGVVLVHPQGFVIGLHRDPDRASSLRGFALVGLSVDGLNQLHRLGARLDDLGIVHAPAARGHLGWYLDAPDPDGILLRFHTGATPDAEEA